ncbi:hypothetical protein TraAM80_02817 [Trypanosoma rangeli]|uniref:Uncharacterized protein n=1 Tax=Trypanosoma rangeli TaxID=5698 RepID=A0A422NS60_TRYRA|nr:uncharacterized protein TraAM80_02817 [Trypanosoma rangeli]RNF08244.1 hypothetical protein TraAM80_02817 [Trypanosoma rangeli]|eukprot:RNF08244.1 hypothetical protein TraAM80_02817 [Trypanosoma rangeli]
MFVQQDIFGEVTSEAKSQVPNLTREEELLLCGVRPGSEFLPLLYSALASLQGKSKRMSPVPSAALRRVAAGNDGSDYDLKGEKPSSGVRERTHAFSPLKNVAESSQNNGFTAFSDVKHGIGYRSQGRLPSVTHNRAMPPQLPPPRVVAPVLMPMCDAAPPAPPRPLPPKVILNDLRGGALPPLNTEVSIDMDFLKGSPRPTGGLNLKTVGHPRLFTSGAIPISHTKAMPAKMGDLTLPLSWPSHEDHTKHLGGRGCIGNKAPLAPLRNFGKSPAGGLLPKK